MMPNRIQSAMPVIGKDGKMKHLKLDQQNEVTVLTLQRERVNALNREVIEELQTRLDELAADRSTQALILTGHGSFFSFGFDVPELYPLQKDDCRSFINAFTSLYTSIYTYPKPLLAALNGHAIAGGCMLALACDRRLMADGAGRISLNEITFGASVFAGSVEMLRAMVGTRAAEEVLLSGTMYEPAQALTIGLIDRIVDPGDLLSAAIEEARLLASRKNDTFRSLKMLLREPIVEQMRSREKNSIEEFVEIWYSESTRKQLKGIEIRR